MAKDKGKGKPKPQPGNPPAQGSSNRGGNESAKRREIGEANLAMPWKCKKCGKTGSGVPATECKESTTGAHDLTS